MQDVLKIEPELQKQKVQRMRNTDQYMAFERQAVIEALKGHHN